MNDFKVLGEYYFSQLANKPILDNAGQHIGRLYDLAIRWDNVSPLVTGIRYAKNVPALIPVEWVESWSKDGIRLNSAFNPEKTCPLHDDETFIGKWLLDKQIVDLEGSRIVRVNDIALSWIYHEEQPYIMLVAVDIGIRGLFRRLGVEFLLKRVENNFVGCQYIKPLENRTSSLQLTREKEQLRQLHPADLADLIEEMDYKQRANFLEALDSQQAIDALSEMELDTQVEMISQMDEERASDILEEMPADEAADILSVLSAKKSEEILSLMESDDAEDVRELMQYEEDTAGSLMTTEYIGLPVDLTAEQAINELRRLAPDAETIYYLYVVNEEEILEGVLSLRELIIASPDTPLQQIIHRKFVKVSPFDDHEKVAEIIHKYGLLAVPVVNERDQVLGIITVDDVFELLMPDRPRAEIHSALIARRRLVKGGDKE